MADHGIIFSQAMIAALIAGRKTQTRRLATSPLRRVQPGDRLWVRERLSLNLDGIHYANEPRGPAYDARCNHAYHPGRDLWLAKYQDGKPRDWPSIHMPRWASRLTLSVEAFRLQRLHDITGQDATAEGIERNEPGIGEAMGWRDYLGRYDCMLTARESFSTLWDSLHSDPGQRWRDNPEIIALSFTVRAGNIDA